jgi:hypothetical protein
MLRFVTEEEGILYLVTNYRRRKDRVEYKASGCWKWPLGLPDIRRQN